MATNTTTTPKAGDTPILTDREWHNMKCDVCVIGWIGLIISSITLLLSAVALHFRRDLADFIVGVVSTFDEHINANKIVIAASTTCYALSLLNLVACTLLLIGVERRSSALLLPWLIYHAVCFAGIAHFGLYVTLTLFFEDLPKFLISLIVFSSGLTIFAKIMIDVFTCISKIEEIEDQRRMARDAEKRKQCHHGGLHGCGTTNSALPYYAL